LSDNILKNPLLQIEFHPVIPRITGFVPKGGLNLFAQIPDFPSVDTEHGRFEFVGGHRLMVAPEEMPYTYVPEPSLSIKKIDQLWVTLRTAPHPATGISKCLTIRLDPELPKVTLEHTLTNHTSLPIVLSPWAVTQLKPGGTAILPLKPSHPNPNELLPNRQITFWPYTQIHDTGLKLTDDYLIYTAVPGCQPFKIGSPCEAGWLAYILGSQIFKKSFSFDSSAKYPDLGCNAEIYGCEFFTELESLAPWTVCEPDQTIRHTEVWELVLNLNTLDPLLSSILPSPH